MARVLLCLLIVPGAFHGVHAQTFRAAAPSPAHQGLSTRDAAYWPGVVVMKLKQRMPPGKKDRAAGIASLDRLLSRFGVTEIAPFLPDVYIRNQPGRSAAVESIYHVFFSADASPEQVAGMLAQDPAVDYAEPRYLHHLDDTPDDPEFPSMEYFTLVQAAEAWDVVKGNAGPVLIAVVDGGTDWHHTDLEGNVWTNPNEVPGNGLDDDGNGFIDDLHGWNFANGSNDPTGLASLPQSNAHGTHVAGIAAAVTDNGIGVASLSWNATFMPVNVANPQRDGGILFGYDGIAYAAANGADIINCSWGRSGGASRFEQDVIDFAYANGALVVAAAGNEGNNVDTTPHYPATYRHVLGVGATYSQFDLLAEFSNYGTTVDVYAPGVSIKSTTPNNTYDRFFTGTSMASPMVAGLAALIKTLQPSWTVDQLREQIRVAADDINLLNPAFDGFLGKGRINAHRAVTDFSSPSVRIHEVRVTDSSGDGRIESGETVDVTLDLVNYLSGTAALSLTLSTPDSNAVLTTLQASLPPLGTDAVQAAHFQLILADDTPVNHRLSFYLDIDDGRYTDRDAFSLVANPSVVADHQTGTVQTSLTTEGNIGALDFEGESPGVGFIHDGQNYLFEGGLMIGTGATTVSDCIRGLNEIQDADFTPVAGTTLTITSPGRRAHEEGRVLLTDAGATTPLGITILQRSYADTAPANQDFIIFHYTITNDNASVLTGTYVGLFFDWDITPDGADWVRYDPVRHMGYAGNAPFDPFRMAATRLLTPDAGVSFRAIDNVAELFEDGFTEAEKWSFLSGGLQTRSLNRRDASTLLAAGPFDIPAHASIDVAFAVIGASSLGELEDGADQALTFWTTRITAVEPTEVPAPTPPQLDPNYPNPFSAQTYLSFSLPEPAPTRLTIYNLMGQTVAELIDRVLPAGGHRVPWDGTNRSGRPVASGVYFYTLETGTTRITRKMVVHR